MERYSLTDGSGRWFDFQAAEKFEENTYHNGSNFISKATGSQWHHENLFLTASGRWILNTWSNYQGTPETYTEISEQEAARWFSKQDFQDKEIPEKLKHLIDEFKI